MTESPIIWSSPNQQVVRDDQSGSGIPIEAGQGPDPQAADDAVARSLAAAEPAPEPEPEPEPESE